MVGGGNFAFGLAVEIPCHLVVWRSQNRLSGLPIAGGEAGVEEAWVVGSLIICASIFVHGLSATLLTRLYGKLTRGK